MTRPSWQVAKRGTGAVKAVLQLFFDVFSSFCFTVFSTLCTVLCYPQSHSRIATAPPPARFKDALEWCRVRRLGRRLTAGAIGVVATAVPALGGVFWWFWLLRCGGCGGGNRMCVFCFFSLFALERLFSLFLHTILAATPSRVPPGPLRAVGVPLPYFSALF